MNEKDFRNLQKVYLDSVFKPNLEFLDFLQEGWRLENKDLKNKDSGYVIKGIVYNEMKVKYMRRTKGFIEGNLNKKIFSLNRDHFRRQQNYSAANF